MTVVNWLILIAGLVGLGCAGYGLVTLTLGAWQRRRCADVAVAVAVAVVTVLLLIAFGDRFVR